VKNSIKVVPLVFLLSMFVIKENIMNRPVYFCELTIPFRIDYHPSFGNTYVWLCIYKLKFETDYSKQDDKEWNFPLPIYLRLRVCNF
jgi:hypothetical protein